MDSVTSGKEKANEEIFQSSVDCKRILTQQSTMVVRNGVHPGTDGSTRHEPYLTKENKLGQTPRNTTTHYHMEGIYSIGFGVY